MNLISFICSIFPLDKKKPKDSQDQYSAESKFFMVNNPKYKRDDIGEWSYGNPNVLRWDNNSMLRIGKYCSFAPGVQILLGGEHRKDWITTYPFNVIFPDFSYIQGHPTTNGDINIGNDVWIGTNALILSGVNIGNGAIIGAGAVVVHDVPAYAVAVGNPAMVKFYRFSEEQIIELEKIQWWNWPIETIKKNIPQLLDDSIQEFLDFGSIENRLLGE